MPQFKYVASGTYVIASDGTGVGPVGYQVSVTSRSWTGSVVFAQNVAPPGSTPSYVNVAYQDANTGTEIAAGTAITGTAAVIISPTVGDLIAVVTVSAGEVIINVNPATQGVTNRELRNAFVAAGYDTAGQDTTEAMLSVAVAGMLGQVLDVRAFGAVGDGVTDDTAAIQAAVDAAIAGQTIEFPPTSQYYRTTATLHIRKKNIRFLGTGFDQYGIRFFGTGAAIELGDEDGEAWDSNTYNGTGSGFTFEGMYLRPGDPATTLANGLNSYKAGTYGIRDWRGGSLRIIRADFRFFEWALWGVQSDLNYTQDCKIVYNKIGVFLGPQSDQWKFDHPWTFGNDTVFYFNGVREILVSHWTSDTDGSGTTCPVVTRTGIYTSNRVNDALVFDIPWLESRGSFGSANPGFDVEAFFDLNTGSIAGDGSVAIRNPFVFVYENTDPLVRHVQHLVKADRLASVTVDGLSSQPAFPWNYLVSVFKVVDDSGTTAPPALYFKDAARVSGVMVRNETPNSVFVQVLQDGFRAYTNVNTGGGEVQMGDVAFHRALRDVDAAPSTGVTVQGDWWRNRLWDRGEAVMWVSAGGSPGIQHPLIIPSVEDDAGNADATLTAGTSRSVQRWNTTLTADRAVTLSTSGATDGVTFRIVRTAAGAFNLNVGTGPLKALAANQWCEVSYSADAAAWILTAFGSL